MPEGLAGVERNSKIVWLFLLKQFQQHTGEAINAGCWLTGTGCPAGGTSGRQGKIGAVCDGVTIEQVKDLGHEHLFRKPGTSKASKATGWQTGLILGSFVFRLRVQAACGFLRHERILNLLQPG